MRLLTADLIMTIFDQLVAATTRARKGDEFLNHGLSSCSGFRGMLNIHTSECAIVMKDPPERQEHFLKNYPSLTF